MTLPNRTDTLTFEEIFPNIKDGKVVIDILMLMAIMSDLHFLQGKCEALEEGIKYWKDKAEG